jgi:hypothetical protein
MSKLFNKQAIPKTEITLLKERLDNHIKMKLERQNHLMYILYILLFRAITHCQVCEL